MALIEQQITDAIITRLETISVANGFLTDTGTTVADSQPNWDESEMPAISVYTGTVASDEEDDEGLLVKRTMPVLIKAFLKRQDTAALDASVARETIADIMSAIASDDRWSIAGTPSARFTREKQHGIEFTENTFEITGAQVEIEIVYDGNRFDMTA